MLIAFKGIRGISSVGRALAWHARGQRFDPAILHTYILRLSALLLEAFFIWFKHIVVSKSGLGLC